MKGVTELAAYGDNIDKMSQKMGMSAQAYQEWDAIMQHSGTSIESMQAGMKTLANAVENGNKAFGRLGMNQQEIANMSQEELFSATITALQNVENETERTYLAGQLLGRGATELGALLNTSAEDTQAMKDRVHELGGVMSDEAVKAAAAFQDSLQDLQTGISGMSRGMLSDFLPAVTQVMDGLTMLLTGDESGLDQISQGIDAFVGNLSQVAPRMFEVGGQLMGSLVTAITSNVPSLIASGTQIIMQFVSGALDMLPDVASAAVEIITTLAGGIAEALPELIPAAIDAILQIIETLTDPDNLSGLIDAALAIILALADGLLKLTPKLLESAPKIVQNLVTTFIQNAPKLLAAALQLITTLGVGLVEYIVELPVYIGRVLTAIKDGFLGGVSQLREAGGQLLEGLWVGIGDKVEWLKGKVSGVVNTIKGWFTGKDGFDEHSPSKWANQVFRYVMEGGGEGLEEGLPGLLSNVSDVVDSVKNGMQFDTANVDFSASAVGQSSAAIINSVGGGDDRNVPVIPLTINLLTGDAKSLAEWILPDLIAVAAANGTPIADSQHA